MLPILGTQWEENEKAKMLEWKIVIQHLYFLPEEGCKTPANIKMRIGWRIIALLYLSITNTAALISLRDSAYFWNDREQHWQGWPDNITVIITQLFFSRLSCSVSSWGSREGLNTEHWTDWLRIISHSSTWSISKLSAPWPHILGPPTCYAIWINPR